MISPLVSSPGLSFHLVPVSSSSFYVHSAVTTAALSWRLGRQECLSHLSLYDTRAQSVTNAFSVGSSESQYTVRGLQPGTRFRADVGVTTFLKHLEMSLIQRLRIDTETGRRSLNERRPCCFAGVTDVLSCLGSSVSSWLAGPRQ